MSEDPITGRGQKKGALYKQLDEDFEANRLEDERVQSWRTIQTKWTHISHDTIKFVGAYATVTDSTSPGAMKMTLWHVILQFTRTGTLNMSHFSTYNAGTFYTSI